jgi:hypothetical protein
MCAIHLVFWLCTVTLCDYFFPATGTYEVQQSGMRIAATRTMPFFFCRGIIIFLVCFGYYFLKYILVWSLPFVHSFVWFVLMHDSCCPFDVNMNNEGAQVVYEIYARGRHDRDVCSCCSVLVFVASCPGEVLPVLLLPLQLVNCGRNHQRIKSTLRFQSCE